MANEDPADGRALDATWVQKQLVTLETTIDDIDKQFLAARSICEALLPRIQQLEADATVMGAAANATSGKLDAVLQHTDLISVVTVGEAIEQILKFVQAISKNTDGNPNN